MRYSSYTSLFLLLLALVSSASAFGDSLKSLACGSDGLSLILRNPQLQDELEISSQQLRLLEELVRKPVLLDITEEQLFAATDVFLATNNSRDRALVPELEKILLPEQRDALRKKMLRNGLPTPLETFRGELLAELELPPEVIQLAKTKCKQPYDEISSKIDGMRKSILEKTLSVYTKEQQQKFVDAFGNDYLPRGILPRKCRVEDITVFSAAKDCGQLLVVAMELRLKGKLDAIDKLFKAYIPISEEEDAATTLAALRQILSQEEQVQVVQRIQLTILNHDLRKLASAEMVNFLQLDENQLEHTRKVTEAGQQEIATFRMTEELRVFDEVMALLPNDAQKTLKKFLEGVWERPN